MARQAQEVVLFSGPQSDVVLAHYGVLGMKWGRRRERGPVGVQTHQVPGRKVVAVGGQNQHASEDAIRVATSKQKARKSTTDSLSTKELQELVTRMNLEEQYARLDPKTESAGKMFARAAVGNLGPTIIKVGVKSVSTDNPRAQKALEIGQAIGIQMAQNFANGGPGGGGKKKKK